MQAAESRIADHLQQARRLLLDPTPAQIDLCTMALTRASREFSLLIESGDAAKLRLAQLQPLREELGVVRALLDCAAEFRGGVFRAHMAVGDGLSPSETR